MNGTAQRRAYIRNRLEIKGASRRKARRRHLFFGCIVLAAVLWAASARSDVFEGTGYMPHANSTEGKLFLHAPDWGAALVEICMHGTGLDRALVFAKHAESHGHLWRRDLVDCSYNAGEADQAWRHGESEQYIISMAQALFVYRAPPVGSPLRPGRFTRGWDAISWRTAIGRYGFVSGILRKHGIADGGLLLRRIRDEIPIRFPGEVAPPEAVGPFEALDDKGCDRWKLESEPFRPSRLSTVRVTVQVVPACRPGRKDRRGSPAIPWDLGLRQHIQEALAAGPEEADATSP